MSLQTPRQRPGIARPSYAGSSPANNNNNSFGASTAVNRKASLQALTGASPDPRTPSARMGATLTALEVGDAVNVPGDMYGVVRFVGSVRGKNGVFVGVELDEVFAGKGKNSGDVEGVKYFDTEVPGAGIFLPIHRATKQYTPLASGNGYASKASPNTPTYSTVNGKRAHGTPPTPSIPAHKFSQTVGPGVRPSSPNFKPKRPSLPRPESPLRRPPPNLAPTPARNNFSQSTRGTRPGITPSKTPNFRASSTTRTTSTASSASHTPRPYSRTGSRLGHRGGLNESVLEEDLTPTAISTNSRTTSQGSVPSFSHPLRSPSRLGSAGDRGSQEQQQELQRLRLQLQERDRRLEEQAASLTEMETSVKELSALLHADGQDSSSRKNSTDDDEDDGMGQSAAQLRQMLREKNEKISLMTAEFDAHRADFRSTLDSLEMASTETERVYEEQKRDLLAQLDSLQEMKEHQNDFEGVAEQLKQLEDLVAELEEGLEESRRGEAEARGEVEFLRGEVERGRSELKRERDKASVSANGGVGSKELDAKDDEITGLKAIIRQLSEGAHGTAAANGSAADEELRHALEESQREKEALEREVELLRRDVAARNVNGNGHVRNESDRTATASPDKSRGAVMNRTRSDTVRAPAAKVPSTANSADTASTYCEMCASSSHDTLDCTEFQNGDGKSSVEEAYSPGKENEQRSGAKGAQQEEEKWCALCEKDGHLAFDCPDEQY